MRFAAKEAIYKALNNVCDLTWKDVEILNQESGRPYVRMIEENYKNRFSSEIIKKLNKAKIDITLSHNNSQAIAYVIVEI